MWKCKVCGGTHTENEETCNTCETARGVWQCSVCGTYNVAAMERCAKCNSDIPTDRKSSAVCAPAGTLETLGRVVFGASIILGILEVVLMLVGVTSVNALVGGGFRDSMPITFASFLVSAIGAAVTMLVGYILKVVLEAFAIITAAASDIVGTKRLEKREEKK